MLDLMIEHSVTFCCGEVAELAEGARLLSECTGKLVPRVRIPPSPPLQQVSFVVVPENTAKFSTSFLNFVFSPKLKKTVDIPA